MRSTLRFLLALVVAFVVMLAFRALVLTIYTVDGAALEPQFLQGDRVVVNRWSYGLRTGGQGLFNYGRLCRQPVSRGDVVAFEDSVGSVLLGRCTALPGDTVDLTTHRRLVVPGLLTCAQQDYYWLTSLAPHAGQSFGFVAEQRIIGRVVMTLYSHDDASAPLWSGYRADRFLKLQ